MIPQVIELKDGNGNILLIINHTEEKIERADRDMTERDFQRAFASITLGFKMEMIMTKFCGCQLFNTATAVVVNGSIDPMIFGMTTNRLEMNIAAAMRLGFELLNDVQNNPEQMIASAEAIASATGKISTDSGETETSEETDYDEPLPDHFNADQLFKDMDKGKKKPR